MVPGVECTFFDTEYIAGQKVGLEGLKTVAYQS